MLPNSPASPRSNDEICVATFAVKIKCSETHLSRFSSAPISALKTAVQQVRFHFLVRNFSLVPAPPAFALSVLRRRPQRSASPCRFSLRNALGIFDRRDVALARPNHFSDRRISGVCDGKKNCDWAQCFDRTCCNFFAPSGGCTLPERMSLAVTDLP